MEESFTLVRQESVQERSAVARLFKHSVGAEVLAITPTGASDPTFSPWSSHVFSIAFQTPVEDSTGIPHILEHSVLCGSKNFPVSDPFAQMLKGGSVSSFLNAFTFPDKTMYPFASPNKQDMLNLGRVYLDAVFFPNVVGDKDIFDQEGWRLEIDQEGNPEIKGVVFSEMKGVFSTDRGILEHLTYQSLYPDSCYRFESGGRPENIPSLTFETFVEFHKKHYHPQNSRAFLLGSEEVVNELLSLLNEYFVQFEGVVAPLVDTSIVVQKPLEGPFEMRSTYMSQKQDYEVAVNYLFPILDEDEIAVEVLHELLMGSHGSPLYEKLLASQLGTEVISSFDSDVKQHIFSAGLKGVKKEDMKKVTSLITATLAELAESTFQPEQVEGAVQTTEFAYRELPQNTQGIYFMIHSLGSWMQGRDPMETLKFEDIFVKMRNQIKEDPQFFNKLVKKYMLENKHYSIVTLEPDATLETKTTEKQKAKEQKLLASLSQEEIETIKKQTEDRKNVDMDALTGKGVETLPFLSLSNVEKERLIGEAITKTVDTGEEKHDFLVYPSEDSDGIVYVEMAIPLKEMDFDLIPLLPLYSKLKETAGTETLAPDQWSAAVKSATGDFSVFASFFSPRSSLEIVAAPDSGAGFLVLKTKFVPRKTEEAFKIILESLFSCKIDNKKRSSEIVKENLTSLEMSISKNGHSFGTTRLSEKNTIVGIASDLHSGISHLEALRSTSKEMEENWEKTASRLFTLNEAVLKGLRSMKIIFTSDSKTLDQYQSLLSKLVVELQKNAPIVEERAEDLWVNTARLELQKEIEGTTEAVITDNLVNYVCFGGRLLAPNSVVDQTFRVVSRFASNGYLWDNVRVIGGAYGSGLKFSDTSGLYAFWSYRDPNILSTLKQYTEMVNWLRKMSRELTEKDVARGIIGALGDWDKPKTAPKKGSHLLWDHIEGFTTAQRTEQRKAFLTTKREDFARFADLLEHTFPKASRVIITSKQGSETIGQNFEKVSVLDVSS